MALDPDDYQAAAGRRALRGWGEVPGWAVIGQPAWLGGDGRGTDVGLGGGLGANVGLAGGLGADVGLAGGLGADV
ncbi:MAG TPA: hypothetical protein VJ347_02440, partial [Streptosporangiaceae bacterium]|nr:hypothetical protein [Streptosporangiaceae bacterium]